MIMCRNDWMMIAGQQVSVESVFWLKGWWKVKNMRFLCNFKHFFLLFSQERGSCRFKTKLFLLPPPPPPFPWRGRKEGGCGFFLSVLKFFSSSPPLLYRSEKGGVEGEIWYLLLSWLRVQFFLLEPFEVLYAFIPYYISKYWLTILHLDCLFSFWNCFFFLTLLCFYVCVPFCTLIRWHVPWHVCLFVCLSVCLLEVLVTALWGIPTEMY